ncbi:MAG: hypothetical protein AB1Z67_06720 [Candidatus Limnocylindrales bacterium]
MSELDGSVDGAPGTDRGSLWIDLLAELTARRADWLVWKGEYASALDGVGDVDSVAPGDAWPAIIGTLVDWARRHGLGPVVVCPHGPGQLHMMALPDRGDLYFELDVNRRKVFLGSTFFRPPQLLPMTVLDERGVRCLRPGAAGVLKLVVAGMRRGARVRWDQIETKGIVEQLRADPVGIEEGAALFGRASGPLLRGARAVLDGRWDRPAMLAVEGWCVARAVREPDAIAWRLRHRWHRHRCPVLRSIFEGGRQVPASERDAWLAEVASYGGHTVIDMRSGA